MGGRWRADVAAPVHSRIGAGGDAARDDPAGARYRAAMPLPSRWHPFTAVEELGASADGTACRLHYFPRRTVLYGHAAPERSPLAVAGDRRNRSEERRVGKECRSRWAPGPPR